MIQDAILTLTLFAINPVLTKYMLRFISIKSLVLLTGIAYLFVSSILLLFLYDKGIQKDIDMLFQRGHYLGLMLLGFPLIHIITHYFYFSLIRDNKTYFATALVSAYPLLTTVFGYFVLHETITLRHIIAISLIVTGVSLLAST